MFHDVENFSEPHTVAWEQWKGGRWKGIRVMFRRLDAQDYIRVLERELVDVYGVKYMGIIKAKVVGESVGNKGVGGGENGGGDESGMLAV